MTESENYNFYKNLPTISQFNDIIEEEHYTPLPEDWVLVLTDVIGSTKAIEAGKYKEVNTAGGIVVMAIANFYEDLDFPFIFGGDGMTFMIPGTSQEKICDILADTREVVKNVFDLDLRVALMPIKEIYEKGYSMEIAKLHVSKYYNQANVIGEGLDWAEGQLKDHRVDNPHLLPNTYNYQQNADFSGFTCRWQDIKSHKEETIALIVKVRSEESKISKTSLKSIFNKIEELLGEEEEYHPLSNETLHTALGTHLDYEAGVMSRQRKGWKRWLTKLKIFYHAFITKQVINFGLNIGVKVNGYQLKELRRAQIIASDFRKYDGTLKMVIALNKNQRITFDEYLNSLYQKGEIFYGIHISDRALMTCMLHEGSTREVHFIDAADGGYTFAAKQMKAQMSLNDI